VGGGTAINQDVEAAAAHDRDLLIPLILGVVLLILGLLLHAIVAPLVFVFLVALGIDYNIFLMTRVREESARFGTRRGALTGLAATGGVITSAGLVLAGHVRRARHAAAGGIHRDRRSGRARRAA
jgi:putative drug exporter of the RND superfamily